MAKNSNEVDIKLKGFYKRWKIDISEDEKWQEFKNRVLNAYEKHLGYEFLSKSEIEDEFYEIIGAHRTKTSGYMSFDNMFDRTIGDSSTYQFLKHQDNLKKILLGIEAISWMKKVPIAKKKKFISDIADSIQISSVPLQIKINEDEIIFYPLGAKLLDKKLVDDNLDWLQEYPKSYELFKKSLHEIDVIGKERNVVDNLRLSLELLLKEKFNNQKSLENQKTSLGNYLKENNVSNEVSNLFITVTDYYNKFQNNNAKHSDNVNRNEIEFILYLTGVIMRFLNYHK